MSERPGRSQALSGIWRHASISASHERRRSASNAAARAPPGGDLGGALLGAAGVLHADLAPGRRLREPPPAVGVASQVGQDLGPGPARQARLGRGLLVGQVGDRPQHPAGPVADRFDVGDRGVHSASASRPATVG